MNPHTKDPRLNLGPHLGHSLDDSPRKILRLTWAILCCCCLTQFPCLHAADAPPQPEPIPLISSLPVSATTLQIESEPREEPRPREASLAGLPPGPYAKLNALIENFKPGLDADKDGYYETFDFDIGINAHGYSTLILGIPLPISVWPKIICNTTGQAWWSGAAWTINGLDVYHLTIYHWNQDAFKGLIKTDTDLDFTVELWNNTKSTRLDQATAVTGEPVKADVAAAVRIASITPSEPITKDWLDTVTWTITGVDAAGKPVKGAVLSVNDTLEMVSSGGMSFGQTDASGQVPYTTTVRNGRTNGTYQVHFMLSLGASPPSAPVTREVRVDHRVTVLGRVIDGDTSKPLHGVRVSSGSGFVAETSDDGAFELLNVPSASDRQIDASMEEYAPFEKGLLQFPLGEDPVRLPYDIRLYLKATNIVVRQVVPRLDGLFLAGVPLENEFTAFIDWAGRPPGTVEFTLNERLLASVTTTTSSATLRSETGSLLKPSVYPSANRMQVSAIDAEGHRSPPLELSILATAVHPLIQRMLEGPLSAPRVAGPSTYTAEINAPNLPVLNKQSLPILKSIDTTISARLRFAYDLNARQWTIESGTTTSLSSRTYGKWLFSMADKELSGNLSIQARGNVTPEGGMEIPPEIGIVASLDGEISFFLYISELFGDTWSRSVDAMLQSTGMDLDAYSFDRIRIYAEAGFSGRAGWKLGGSFVPSGGHISTHIGAGMAYEPRLLDWLDMKAYLMGDLEGRLEMGSKVEVVSSGSFAGGLEFHVLGIAVLSYSEEWPIRTGGGAEPSDSRRSSNLPQTLRPIERRHLLRGPERFLGTEATAAGVRTRTLLTTKPVTIFQALGEAKTSGAGGSLFWGRAKAIPPQSDLIISQNITTESHPALAARGTDLMLVYPADNGSPNPLQFTDLRWTRWDGNRWTTPRFLTQDTRAEFSPQIAFDGNGDAIAVWVRVADAAFTQLDLGALAAELEIVWARWDRTTGEWSEPVALTDDRKLDNQPRLSGPLSDGSLLLVWTHNDLNRLLGGGAPGAPENDQVMWTRWSPAAGNWSYPGVLVSNLTYRLSQSLTARDGRGVYAWTTDADGDIAAGADQGLHYREWTNGVWLAAQPVDSATNSAARVRAVVGPNEDINLFWTQGSNLVRQVNFTGPPSLVRPDADGLGFADYEVTAGPGGEIVLLWQDATAEGPDAHFRVYDPAAEAWSEDLRLTRDPSLERSFSPVWDAAGNLTVAYCKVEMLRTNHTIAGADGVPVTITNFPTPGRVDLLVTKRALARDVALLPGDFRTEGDSFLPGQPLSLIAEVRNLGATPVSNVVVRFYDGDPSAGGTRIRESVLSDWLPAGGTATATNAWLLPAPATPHQIFAVVDPEHQIGEWPGLETNNVQSVAIGGTDLAVVATQTGVSTNGAIHFDITVRNLGGPASVACQLTVRPNSVTNEPFAVAKVPALDPGASVRISADGPAGTQPEGNRVYSVAVDEARVSPDANPSNNRTELVVSRWVDDDGDGLPNSWEAEHGTDVNDPADATLDLDGDELSNLQEFYSGTDPRDANSYLYLRPEPSAELDRGNGLRLLWISAASRVYTLERTESLGTAFSPIRERIPATPPENEYIDLSATNRVRYFYRVKAE
ncbi:MAG: hypothetical protein IT581_21065 [Verrucomicrobiales bacterium]|nr:hypothetical protein [Verrucomicrobiales bacterium]